MRFGRPVLLGALTLGPLIFAALLLGQSLTRQFESVASLYTYFAATIVIFAVVLLMPPYRPMHWLSSLGARDGHVARSPGAGAPYGCRMTFV